MITLPKGETPCYNCKKRNEICHAICTDYKEYESKHKSAKEKADAEKRKKVEIGDYVKWQKEKRRKRYG